MTTDTYAAWDAALKRARLAVAPTELHGSITGFLCAGWGGHARELLAALELDDTGADAELTGLLERAAASITARLRTRQPIELLLPDAALAIRADAVVDWCRGFLGGLGLTGVAAGTAPDSETGDLLQDFGHIASMHLECADDDEATLDDVLAFIRSGVAHLHSAFAPVARQ